MCRPRRQRRRPPRPQRIRARAAALIFRESIAAAARRVKRFIRKLSSKKSSMYMFFVQPHRPRCRGFLLPSLRRTGTGVRVPYPPEAMITPKARLQCRSRGATGGKEWGIKAECGMRRSGIKSRVEREIIYLETGRGQYAKHIMLML